MTDEDIFERIQENISQIMKIKHSEITPDMYFSQELNMDSLDIMQLYYLLENNFDINIQEIFQEVEIEKIRQVKDLVALTKKYTCMEEV